MYDAILLSHKKKKEILPFGTTWMDLECIMLSEIKRKTNTVWFHIYVECKKQNKWTNITKQKKSYRYIEQTGGGQRGGGWEEERNRWGRLRGTRSQLQNK